MDEDELLADNFRGFLKSKWIPQNKNEQNKLESVIELPSKTLADCLKKSNYDLEKAMKFISSI